MDPDPHAKMALQERRPHVINHVSAQTEAILRLKRRGMRRNVPRRTEFAATDLNLPRRPSQLVMLPSIRVEPYVVLKILNVLANERQSSINRILHLKILLCNYA